MIKGPKTTGALRIVLAHADGIESRDVATALGVSQATAAGILARLFWRSLVDRRTVGRSFVYTPRQPRS